MEELMCGALDPATVVDLGKKRLNEIGLDIFLDGIVATLNKAPWGRAESGYEYVVVPGMRLDFLQACQDVLVDVRVIKSLSVKIHNISNIENELSVARRSVLREWDKVRQGCAVPPTLWNIVHENINSKLSAA